MAGINYHELVAEFCKHDNYDDVFRSTLEDMAAKMDFSQVKSCVAFGTGSGEHEIEFARRLLPNLRSFTAVEPDPESVKALRANFQDGQLPGVETSIVQTSIESWNGVDSHVDAVLFFNMLYHVHTTERKAVFEKLGTHYLSYGGIVVICSTITSGMSLILKQLGMPRVDYDELEEELVAAGFRVGFKQDFEVCRDLPNHIDSVMKFIKMMTDHKFSESEIHKAIEDIGLFSQSNIVISKKKLAIFTK